uniref:DKNYY domain-containing protein n=1 Tax=Candidatus Amarolinea aalborgensis TaxID=2249329 RepID=UPI003BF981E4
MMNSDRDGYEVRGNEVYYVRTVYVLLISYRDAKLILEADGKTFEILDKKDYARDSRHVFYQGSLLPGSDSATFRWRSPSFYAWDANQVYCNGRIIRNAQPGSFEPLGNLFARDKHRVYLSDLTVQGADPATFEIVKGNIGRDRQDYYVSEKPLHVRDIKTFKMLKDDVSWNDIWAADKWNYYVGTDASPIADAGTFQVMEYGYAKDAKHAYYLNTVLADADV